MFDNDNKAVAIGFCITLLLLCFVYYQSKCSYCWSFHLARTRVVETKDGVESKTRWCYHHWNFRRCYSDVDNGEQLPASGKYIIVRKFKKDN